MKIPTVSKFCFCCDLKVGNKICAWLYVFSYLFIATIVVFSFVFEVDLIDFKKVDGFEVNKTSIYEIAEVGSSKVEFFDAALTIVICVILAIVAFIFIDGINMNDPNKMSPFIIQTIIFGTLFLIAGVYFLSIYFIIKGIVWFYVFLTAYSLQVFMYEKAQRDVDEAEMRKYTDEVYGNLEEGGKYHEDNYEETGDFQGP